MKAGGPLLLEGQGRLLKEVFPVLVDRFEARRSSVGVMCTEESGGGDCFLFMVGPGEKNQSVMFTFDLGHVNKGSEQQQAPPTFCTLPMDGWKETQGTDGISHLLLPFDLPQAFFAFHNYQEGKEDHNGQLMYSRSEVKMVTDPTTGSRCPKVANQHFTKRFICCSSQDSADGWVSDKPCTEPWAMIDLIAAFVYGGHSYNFAAEVVFRMPLLEMLQHLQHHTAWKRVPRADFWGRWEPPPDGPTEPPPPTDYWSSTSSKGTKASTGHSSTSSSDDDDASKKLSSSSTTSRNSKLLLLILLIVVLICALIGGAVLFCFCCSSRRKKQEEKSTKKKAHKKKEVKSKAGGKNKEKSTSKPGNSSSQSSPVPKTTSFFPPSSSAQSGSKQAPPSSSASASAAKAVASTNASLATKAPLSSKVTIRSKMTTAVVDKERGKSSSLPAVEKMPSYSETSIMTDARKKNTSTSAGAGRSSQSKRQPTTRSKLSTVKK